MTRHPGRLAWTLLALWVISTAVAPTHVSLWLRGAP
jgi:hypothetical protein